MSAKLPAERLLRVWRICKREYAKSCLNGDGARLYGGRWNSKGHCMVYTSSTLSLAALELFVHVESANVPTDLVAVSVLIEPTIARVKTLVASQLPSDWRMYPTPVSTQQLGDTWLASKETAILEVPSVVIPSERNLLINPDHPESRAATCEGESPFEFDPRMWK